MNPSPYQIIKHNRGQYQVLDPQGFDPIGEYVSKHGAEQTVIEYKLQNKALNDERLLKVAQSITTRTGEALKQWLYEILIRTDTEVMRKLIKRPNTLKTMWEDIKKQASEMDKVKQPDTLILNREQLIVIEEALVFYKSSIINRAGITEQDKLKDIERIHDVQTEILNQIG